VNGLSLEQYLERLASGDPEPGGGAAVAVTGAQAAALLAMVVRVTGDADKVTPREERERTLATLDRTRVRLLDLAAEDGRAFGKVMDAYKLPQGTPEDKQSRRSALQEALKSAALVPLEVLQQVNVLFDVATSVIANAKPTVVSDAAIAVHLMGAAIRAGRYNVLVNVKLIKDEEFVHAAKIRLAEATGEIKRQKKELLRKARKVMGK